MTFGLNLGAADEQVGQREGAGGIPPTGRLQTLAIFGGAALLLLVSTRVLIPFVASAADVEPVIAWFAAGGLCVFAPLVLAGFVILRRERQFTRTTLWARLRFRRLSRGDLVWATGAVVLIGILSAILHVALAAATGNADLQPAFMVLDPVGPGRYWILAAWLPFWLLNILGEEFLWRGVLLPRQEVAFGANAWYVNALGWFLFHLAFGWHLMVVLIPILFILPYVVQRRENASLGIVIHAAVNGPGFIAVAFGLV